MRIFGIDPGSLLLGYGCVDLRGSHLQHVAHGTLKLSPDSSRRSPIEERLLKIFQDLSSLLEELKPDIAVIERVFFAKNALSALKLGHARGVALLACRMRRVPIEEYAPTEVKLAIAGNGHAQKEEISRMVQLLIGKRGFETLDASDALALAICHARRAPTTEALNSAARGRTKLREGEIR